MEFSILQAGILLLLGVLFSRISDWFGVPLLLVFLGLGMLAGSEGVGGIGFDAPEIAQTVGTIALMIILFAGGLDTKWKAIKPVLVKGIVLSTLGVCLTTVLLGSFAWYILGSYSEFDIGSTGLSYTEALLLAAIVSSTDAAAVFSVYRSSTVQPVQRLRHLLEFESGSNDPMAVLITTAILGYMTDPGSGFGGIAGGFFLQFFAGGGIGFLVGLCGAWVANRKKITTKGMYPILIFAHAFLAFGIADFLGGNGYLSVYVAGCVLGNRLNAYRESVMEFHDGLSWFMQISMFILLGLLVFPSHLIPVAGVGTMVALFLMFVARPVSVWLCMIPFGIKRKDMMYISWVGLRGSVPIVLATFPMTYGIEGSETIFSLIFFVVLTSVLVQGLTLVPCARWLGVTAESENL